MEESVRFKPTASGGFNPLSMYPIGSIYQSTDPTDPSELFGGTWQMLKDVFLMAAGDKYAAGSTGGEAEHVLTEREMPSHVHDVQVRAQGYDGWETYTSSNYGFMFKMNADATGYHGPNYSAHSAIVAADAKTGYSGDGQPHNNLPPYLAVYTWVRVA